MSDLQTIERRYFPAEMRVDSQGRIEGYAAVFNELSEVLWGFREIIRHGAFTKTIQEADVRGLFNHDPNYVLGRNRAGTLDLSEDSHGLHFRATPPEASWVGDLKLSIQRGDIDQGSFGFDTVRDEWHKNENGETQRELIETRLWDVSVVTFPAYPQTSVGLRSLANLFMARMASHGDPEMVQELIDELSNFIPAAPVQEDHPADGGDDDEARVRLTRLRRRLELAEMA